MNETASVQAVSGEGGGLFGLSSIDLSPLTETVVSNAPMIIGAGIAFMLVKKAVPLIPALINKLIK